MRLLVQFIIKQNFNDFAMKEFESLCHLNGVDPKTVFLNENVNVDENAFEYVELPSAEVAKAICK
jgi:hypothetical protein